MATTIYTGDNGGSDNIAFGISVAPGNKEIADLIQHGHMTPFGGQIIDGVSHDGKGITSNSTILSNSTITNTSNESPFESSSIESSELRNIDNNYEIHDEIEIVGKGKGKKRNVDDDTYDSGSDDAFVPEMNDDFYYSTSDSSYITDDEDSRAHSSRAKRYRDIISSESDDDMIHTNKVKQKKVKNKAPLSRRRSRALTVDDGDDQLYKMRIKYVW